ncbi:hypothetical protein [Agrobacterium sp.]|jgi:hypothetical protein|uniref:hypothetical protein n=1 Tax=Agrobacterium sp. TaxID=361 RepID=UPI0028B09303|nr:hypothetical protein [Agrobacterium sp.]
MQVENAFSGTGNLFVLNLAQHAVSMWQKQAGFIAGIGENVPHAVETSVFVTRSEC